MDLNQIKYDTQLHAMLLEQTNKRYANLYGRLQELAKVGWLTDRAMKWAAYQLSSAISVNAVDRQMPKN